MKKKIILGTIIMFLLCLTGCTTYSDISNIAVVELIGINKDKNYTLFVKIASSNEENEEIIYEEEGKTLEDCFNSLNTKLLKRLYLTHLDLLILGNNIEKEEINDILNFFFNEESARNSFTVISTSKIEKEHLEHKDEDIINMLELSTNTNGLAKNKTFEELVKEILNYGEAYIPYFDFDELELLGYKEIYQSNKILTKEESIALNIIKNNTRNLSLMIKDDMYKLDNCITNINVKDSTIEINFFCKTKQGKGIIEKYLKDILQDYIDNNSQNYFQYLVYKYGKDYQDIKNLEFTINIDIVEEEKGGKIFE